MMKTISSYQCYPCTLGKNSVEIPFSFWCTICFEPFDSVTHYPVVLTCGHTYLCNPCARRLTRCMECRTNLFVEQVQHDVTTATATSAAAAAGAAHNNSHNSSSHLMHVQPVYQRQSLSQRAVSRYNQYQQQQQQQQQMANNAAVVKKVPLPLPKNYVLLSLMEASVPFCSTHGKDDVMFASTSMVDDGDGKRDNKYELKENDDDGDEYDSDDDRMHVSAGLDVLTGPCGTYVVTVKELPVVSTISAEDGDSENDCYRTLSLDGDIEGSTHSSFDVAMRQLQINCDEDSVNVTSSISFEDPEPRAKKVSQSRKSKNESSKKVRRPVHILKYGDMIQVIDFKDGYAVLSRNRGYVKTLNSIVKIGPPQDDACKLESIIISLGREQGNMNKYRVEMLNKIKYLKTKLITALSKKDDFPERVTEDQIARIMSKLEGASPTKNDDNVYVSPCNSQQSTPVRSNTPSLPTLTPGAISLGPTHFNESPTPSILRSSRVYRADNTPTNLTHHVAFTENDRTYTPSPTGNLFEQSGPFGMSQEANSILSMPILTQSAPAHATYPLQPFSDDVDNALSPYLCADMFGLIGEGDGGDEVQTSLVNSRNPLFSEIDTRPALSPRSGNTTSTVDFRGGMSCHTGAMRSNTSQRSTTYSRTATPRMMSHYSASARRVRSSSRDDGGPLGSPPKRSSFALGLQNTKTW